MHVYKAWAHDVALSIDFTLSVPTAQVSDFSNNAVANQYVAYLARSSGAVDDCAPTNDELAHLYPPLRLIEAPTSCPPHYFHSLGAPPASSPNYNRWSTIQ